MNYKDWVPPDLVAMHQRFPELAQYVIDIEADVKSGRVHLPFSKSYAHWAAGQKEWIATVTRLISRPEMEGFWAWEAFKPKGTVEPRELVEWLSDAISLWEGLPRLPKKARQKEFEKIAALAKELGRRLEQFHLDAGQLFGYHFLMTPEDLYGLSVNLRPELVEAFKKTVGDDWEKKAIPAFAHGILPPLHYLVLRAAIVAEIAAKEEPSFLHHTLPRKMNDKNSRRTYLIEKMHDYLVGVGASTSPSKIAVFLSVALDDAEITADLVRKIARDFTLRQPETPK